MAPERTSRPELADMEEPSPEEVRRYVDRLYDRAESDTGTFNATRAAAIPRQRGTAVRGRSEDDVEPAIGTLARQWFDAARAKLGPTVSASQPDRRPPALPEGPPRAARPERSVEARPEPLALEAPKAPTGVARELPAGPERTSTTGSLPQLPQQRVSSTVVGESRWDESEWRTGAQPVPGGGDAAAWPVYEPAPASAPETGALPTVPEPAPAAYLADLPLSGAELYGDVPATGAPAPYADLAGAALPADPSAYLTTGSPADVLTATYGAGLPDVSAVLEAPAPTVLPAPAVAPAPAAPAAPTVPAGSWPAPAPVPSPEVGHRTQAERVIAFARAQIGRPCVWGAVGPGSYDAPGLTQAAWKAAGVTLPRSAEAQWTAGVQVPLAEVRAGDLVFFHDDLRHVGIWSGDGMMIHAPGPGALIREESVFFAGQSEIRGAVRPA
ncbi:NlpC/P60 family protein [Streptomyces sp. enrichment culture]|uniref:C40 family peptidase n=1 Tax=Streptomyces sp. enrichment culture TaxID=1795815 RepID=UPI003F577EAE